MSTSKHRSGQCILPSELSEEQLASLPFVPGSLDSFDEKNKLPPTARAQWAYVHLNPTDYLDRFTSELGLLGTKVAICFINKDPYHDTQKDLKTPITVNLIVQPEDFERLKDHLMEKKLSHQPMEEGKGFSLPYLGSIQKTLDTLALENLYNYVFLKNTISREAYSTWLSVPESYLKKKTKSVVKKDQQEESEQAESDQIDSEESAESSRPEQLKENFNYVIYDDEDETPITLAPQEKQSKVQSVVVAAEPQPKKESLLNRFSRTKKSKKEKTKQSVPDVTAPHPTAKFDSSLFLSLSLFNFYCSVILLNFMGKQVDVVASMMVEAVSFSALLSLLFAILVIRPSLRHPSSRFWALGAYTAFTGIAGYQIFQGFSFPESSSYLVPTAITLVCLISALISAFMRIDRLSLRKNQTAKEEKSKPEEKTQTSAKKRLGTSAVNPSTESKDGKKETKKITMRAAMNGREQSDSAHAGVGETPKSAGRKPPASENKPAKPISDAQKEVIRNRLSQTGRLTVTTTPSDASEAETEEADALKPLSTQELKAKLASRLEKKRSSTTGTKNAKGEDREAEEDSAAANSKGDKKGIKLKKRNNKTGSSSKSDEEGSIAEGKDESQADKKSTKQRLSLPNG